MAEETERTFTKKQNTLEIANQISKILQEIRFGSVEIIIHENRVVQIERKEKIRLDAK
ncbi:MAG: YezD family protein [Methylobacter sp.]|nr:YezD family protein [Methylobacter sp.]